MARRFENLKARMPAKRRARAEARASRMLMEMLLCEIRKVEGLTQVELAAILGIRQPSLSKLESRRDMQVGTLRRIVEALGGQLTLIARFPDRDIRLSQFDQERG